ncbi:MAG: hypothetical protein AAFQ91_04675 [Cyanobacteria bacterium J06621_15]
MDNQNSKKIYRKKALAQLSSPEKLDEMMKVINPKSWLILIAFSFLIITGITWGIFGYIPITTEVKGQLVNGAIELIDSPESGILAEFKVKKGDTIQEGQTIAKIKKIDAAGKAQIKDLISDFSGRVISTVSVGTKVVPKTHLAIVEKANSSSQKSIFCLSSPEECQKIKAEMKVKVIANQLQEDFTATVKNVSPLLIFEDSSANSLQTANSSSSLIPQVQSVTIQEIGNIQIKDSSHQKLEQHPVYPVSIRATEKHSPISFILPKS